VDLLDVVQVHLSPGLYICLHISKGKKEMTKPREIAHYGGVVNVARLILISPVTRTLLGNISGGEEVCTVPMEFVTLQYST
jgi:hypothetical protein